MNPGPSWKSRAGQLIAVVRLEWSKGVAGRRFWWILLLAALPVLLAAAHSLAMLRRGEWRHTLTTDSRIFAGLFQLAYLRFAIYFGCVIVFANLFRGDALEKTLHHYLLAPLRRDVLAVAKFAAGLGCVAPLFAASVTACYLSLIAHFGPRAQEFLFRGEGLAQLAGYLTLTLLAAVGYGAIFLLAGQLFTNPMLPAAVLLAWESLNSFLPPVLQKLSVVYYLKSLAPVKLPETGLLAVLASEPAPMAPWRAVAGLLLFSASIVGCAALCARRLEVRYDQ